MHNNQNHSLIRVKFIIAMALLTISETQAQSNYVPEKHVRYFAKESVELGAVINDFMTSHDAYKEVIALNPGVDPLNIQPKQVIILPRKWLRYKQAQAQVSYLRCDTPVTLKDSTQPLNLGSSLKKDDVIHIPAQCQLSIKFQDESTIRMPSGGTIKIATLRTNPFESTPEIHVELLDGRLEVKVAKKPRADGTFEVRTPKSVAGVRGTDFRVGFDSKSDEGQVEVSKGLVSARGMQSKTTSSVSGQFGIAMPKNGETGSVEPLPSPTSLSSIQPQHDPDWLLFIFNQAPDAAKYYLSEFNNANLIDALEKKTLPSPRYLSTEPLTTARFLQWTPVKENGLQGDSRVFGVCDSTAKQQPYRCDVRFNLSGTFNSHLRIYKLDAAGNKKLFLKNSKPMHSLNDAIVRSMQAGLYSWEISYQSTSERSEIFRQTGEFELVAIARP